MEQQTYECTLCPRKCGAQRFDEYGRGYCRMGLLPKISRAALHMWEEPCISGKNGSGTIFFTGCVLSCVFCQNYKISAEGQGIVISVRELVEEIRTLEAMGAHNINLVSPTPYVDSIIKAFEIYRPSIPIVYNTGGYERVETLRRLEGIVDIYLPDLKYISSEKSGKYSGAADYFEYASKALEEMVRQTGKPVFDSEGMMQRGTIVRHLILPSNTGNSIEVIRYLDKAFGDNILVSLMGQYIPEGRAKDFPELDRRITKREYSKVLDVLGETSLDGFAQELTSADKRYIPDFDMQPPGLT